MHFLDTNVFLRYLTRPDPPDAAHLIAQVEKAKAIFEQIDARTLEATTSEGVLIEVVWILSSKTLYNVPRPDVQQILSPLLRLPGLTIPHKRTYFRALDLYAQYPFLDFVDALSVAHMERQGVATILSFDHDFDRIPGVQREEG